MTAYGRASMETLGLHWVIEMHSINQKGLNIHLHAPKELLCFDIDMRKWIAEAIGRGQITIRINIKQAAPSLHCSEMQLENLQNLKKKWQNLAVSLGYSGESVDLPFLAGQLQTELVLDLVKDEESARKSLKKLFFDALDDLMKMKALEGKNLSKDIQERMKKIQKKLETIAAQAEKAPAKYRAKLEERLKTLLAGAALDESRLYQEVALFAEKVDITEELERLDSHLKQLFELFKGKEKSVGRALDFLIQEMLREVNTMGSKSDLEIGKICIEIKGELEKLKEQVQNLE